MKIVDKLRFKIIDMNKTILAIETSSSICSASLFKNGENIGILENDTDRKHAEVLPGYVVSLLENNQLKIKNIDAIAVSIGPGSFTGLRVGLSFAKGLAYAIKCPIIPVPTILAMAYSLRSKKPLNGIIRSHGEKIFFQEFIWDKKVPSIKDKPVLGDIHNYLDKVRGGFHFNCEEFLINAGNIYSAKPSSKDIAKLANIYFEKWHVPKPYGLTSEYIYPYVIKSND